MGHLGKEVQGSKFPEHSLELRDTCSRWALPRCPWDLWPKGEGVTQPEGVRMGLTILAFSTGLENSPCEPIEDLRRVSPIVGLKKKATHREDAVEPKFFYF